MKRTTNQFIYPAALIVVVALLAFIVLASASPLLAASSKPSPAASKVVSVEARIKELHTALKITPEQEELWNNVAQVMRDNAKTMDELVAARSEKAGTMTAVDDFKSYGEITEAHADGVKKFIPVFEALYASMSDAQKKNADAVFAHRHPTKSKAKGK
ncbi:MAG TPA: Spy/CpxP family protein refolding chaperone [Syntrophales bacterium]|nr:Spy/CpxP family protein refolding chaperone [Syntrophales bacterium]